MIAIAILEILFIIMLVVAFVIAIIRDIRRK